MCACASLCILNQSLEKNQLESKLDFSFISFPYKLNCLDFCLIGQKCIDPL